MGNHSSSKSIEQNLTDADIESIRKTWSMMTTKSNLKELGNGLMARTLIEHKELKQLWKSSMVKSSTDDNNQHTSPVDELDLSYKRSQLMKSHGERVFEIIMLAINSIDDLDRLAKQLNQLGYEHFRYGTKLEHLEYMGDALISTLSDTLQQSFTDKIEKSWVKFFSIIEFHMVVGMDQAQLE